MNSKAFLSLAMLSAVQTLALSEASMMSRIVISTEGFQEKIQNSSKVPLRGSSKMPVRSTKSPKASKSKTKMRKSTKASDSTKSPKSSKSETNNSSATTTGASLAAVQSSSASLTRALKIGAHGMVVAAIVSCWF